MVWKGANLGIKKGAIAPFLSFNHFINANE
jgi:hypothetical protein